MGSVWTQDRQVPARNVTRGASAARKRPGARGRGWGKEFCQSKNTSVANQCLVIFPKKNARILSPPSQPGLHSPRDLTGTRLMTGWTWRRRCWPGREGPPVIRRVKSPAVLKGRKLQEPGVRDTDHAWAVSPYGQVLRRGVEPRRAASGSASPPGQEHRRGVWHCHILKLTEAGPHTLFPELFDNGQTGNGAWR